jgi:hypothetical protein
MAEMVPDVPPFQVQQFCNWLQEHQVEIKDHSYIPYNRLLYLAKQFLSEDNLLNLLFLQILQDDTLIKLPPVFEEVKGFIKGVLCFNYMENYIEKYKIDSLYSLPPLLVNFLSCLNKKELSREIDIFFAESELQPDRVAFRLFINKFSPQVFEEFLQYIRSVDQRLIEGYFSNTINNYRLRADDIRGIEEGTKILGVNEDLYEAADRLAFAIKIEKNLKHFHCATNHAPKKSVILGNFKYFVQFFEFIAWLNKSYNNNLTNLATSQKEIKEIVTQFCQELNYDNVQEFSKEVRNGLLPTVIGKVINILLIQIIPEKNKRFINLGLSKFLERYEKIHFHSFFLFGENNNLSEFVKNHGRDLHDLTNDYMDIYYSHDDFKKHNETAYQRRKHFRNLEVGISHIPAFIIWKDSLTNSQVISLEGLSHQQMFDVVKHITSGIEQKKSLDEVSKIGRDKVESYLNHVGVVNYNVGQAAAVGSNAIASDTVFNQLFQKTDNEEDL